MLEWKITNADEKMQQEIQRCKETFDDWFYRQTDWHKRITKEEFLSENSPLPRVYYKMCKTPDENKERFGKSFMENCSSCGALTDTWIETSFSFCDEYGCGMSLCKECAKALQIKLIELLGGDA